MFELGLEPCMFGGGKPGSVADQILLVVWIGLEAPVESLGGENSWSRTGEREEEVAAESELGALGGVALGWLKCEGNEATEDDFGITEGGNAHE